MLNRSQPGKKQVDCLFEPDGGFGEDDDNGGDKNTHISIYHLPH